VEDKVAGSLVVLRDEGLVLAHPEGRKEGLHAGDDVRVTPCAKKAGILVHK
jgi:hypothetical protein